MSRSTRNPRAAGRRKPSQKLGRFPSRSALPRRTPSAPADLRATELGDDVMKKIVGTSLDKPSEITALSAMDEQERQQIIERDVLRALGDPSNTRRSPSRKRG